MIQKNESHPPHLPPDKMIERLNDVRKVIEGFDDYLHSLADQSEEMGDLVGSEPPVTITVSQTYSILNVFQFIRCSANAIQDALARTLTAASPKERQDIVPGMMKCAKCKFVVVRTNLYVQSGTTGPGDNTTEPCPNGCGPLWPLTWKERALDAEAMLEGKIA